MSTPERQISPIQCDLVFDILTRGPFPSGEATDGAVEVHLTECDACRDLAEALRPALELFQEAVSPEESLGLPGYRGQMAEAFGGSGRPSALIASQLAPWLSRPRLSISSRWSRLLSFGACVAAGLLLGGVVRHWATRESDDRTPLRVHAACLPPALAPTVSFDRHVHTFSLSAADRSLVHCCTECHGSTQPVRISPTAFQDFTLACATCHDGS
jgi:hypothetical protein